jgi:hypothetical protein
LQRQQILHERVTAQFRHQDLAGVAGMQRRRRGFAVDHDHRNARLPEAPDNTEPAAIVGASHNDGGYLCAQCGGQRDAIRSPPTAPQPVETSAA